SISVCYYIFAEIQFGDGRWGASRVDEAVPASCEVLRLWLAAGRDGMPTACVITRTKGRPLLSQRAAQRLTRQSFRDFMWIVADDSGGTDPIEPALAIARNAGIPVRAFRVTDSKGMESASNQALALAESDLVTFLDDDDSWEPAFLAETTT